MEEHPLLQSAQGVETYDGGEKEVVLVHTKKRSSIGTGVIFFKASFGVGSLGVPYAFRQGGIVTGLVATAGVTVLITYTLIMLLRSVDKLRADGAKVHTLAEFGAACWGWKGEKSVTGALLGCQLGTLVAYFIFAATSLTGLIMPFFDLNFSSAERYNLYLLILVLLVPLMSMIVALIRDMHIIDTLVFLSMGIMLTGICEIVGYGLINPTLCGTADHAIWCPMHMFTSFENIPIVVGVVTFALEGLPTVLPIERTMEDPRQYKTVVVWSMAALGAAYAGLGTLFYALFGHNTTSVIALDVSGPVGTLVKLQLTLVVFLSFPLQFLPIREVVEKQSLKWNLSRRASILAEASVLGACGLTAALLPHFGALLSLVGCICFSFLGFLVPPYAWLMLGKPGPVTVALAMCCVAFGLMEMIFGTVSNINELAKHYGEVAKM